MKYRPQIKRWPLILLGFTRSLCNAKKKFKKNTQKTPKQTEYKHLCICVYKPLKKKKKLYNSIEIIAAFWECTSCIFFHQGHLFPVSLNSQFLLLAATVIEPYLWMAGKSAVWVTLFRSCHQFIVKENPEGAVCELSSWHLPPKRSITLPPRRVQLQPVQEARAPSLF